VRSSNRSWYAAKPVVDLEEPRDRDEAADDVDAVLFERSIRVKDRGIVSDERTKGDDHVIPGKLHTSSFIQLGRPLLLFESTHTSSKLQRATG
jgi:hypothetical protein